MLHELTSPAIYLHSTEEYLYFLVNFGFEIDYDAKPHIEVSQSDLEIIFYSLFISILNY